MVTEDERDVCAVHGMICERWQEVDNTVKKRVPIWVFVIAISITAAALSWVNVESAARHERVQLVISGHISSADRTFKRLESLLDKLVHSHTEVAMNQRRVMKQAELDFEEIPYMIEEDR